MTLYEFLSGVQSIADSGPGYKLGASGDNGWCDCIGLIIGACEHNGVKWTGIHGSNWWARHYTAALSAFSGVRELKQGDLVYKARASSHRRYALPSRYAKDPDQLDYYHVGVVQSVKPLRIIHCTTPGIKIDNRRGSWSHRGRLTLLDDSSAALPLLRRNARGDAVALLQQLLCQEGFDLACDGIFGPKTLAAVRCFQKRHKLDPDGIVGPLTWGALYRRKEQ